MPTRARLLLLALTAVVSCVFASSAQALVTDTLSYTGDVQTWTVPTGVNQVTFDLYGAQGGGANAFNEGFAGGLGGEAKMTVAVTPGQTFSIYVGGAAPSAVGSSGPGGFNGGGPGDGSAWGGGGGTDVRSGGTALSDRILVAGGGGGAGGCAPQGATGSAGGAGGGLTGGNGVQGCQGDPGHGGTQTDGGLGTFAGGSKGSLGQGGAGGNDGGFGHGSGGGGGYYGGGGGGDGGPGGGGSGYGPGATFGTGVQAGNGKALISYRDKVLTVTPAGTGSGYVDSSPTGLDCGRNVTGHTVCDPDYDRGTSVTLTAHPDDSSSNFDGFNGDCVSQTATTCTVQMDAAHSVTASFTLKTRHLTLATDGTGGGAIERDPDAAECTSNMPADPTCTPGYPHGTQVLLVAHHHDNSTFAGWSGGVCSGRVSACTVTMDADKQVTATFNLKQWPLSLTTDGTGSGYVDSTPSGVDCGRNTTGHTDCSPSYDDGALVTLTAHPDANTGFTGFSGGGCSGASTTCVVTMSEARSVTASFALDATPPSTTITPTGVHNGWAHGLSVTATDDSGVAETRCWVDPLTAPTGFNDTGSAACPSTLSDGTHEVYAASKDNAGNVNTPVHATVKIDTNAPVLHLPSALAIDATGPSGATVPFTATATDATSGPASQAATCTPASGASFPIGDTTVDCSASDVAGNAAAGQFGVHVRGADEQLAALLTATQALRPRSTQLEALVADAQASHPRACSDLLLYRTIAGLFSQLGNNTAALRTAADRILAVLGCSAATSLEVTPPGGATAVEVQAPVTGAGLPARVVAAMSAVANRDGARLSVAASPVAGSATIAASATTATGRKTKAQVVVKVKKAKKKATTTKKIKKAKKTKRRHRRR